MASEIEKRAPVQGYSAGIPWSMHLRAYDAYCKRHGEQQALVEGWCRGGFSTGELDMFIPGWREELSELHQLRKTVAAQAESLRVAEEALGKVERFDLCAEMCGEHPCSYMQPSEDGSWVTYEAVAAALARLREGREP